MGANAVTTVPVYTAGEILTAADLNITNSGIPVFADTTARDAAFGGTGEKVLAEGQMAYIEATNTTQYYDGAAWQTLGPAGMVLVQAETAFTAVASYSANNVFTSAYRNYRIFLNPTEGAGSITMKLRASSVDTSTNYNGYNVYGTTSVLFANNALGTDEWYLCDMTTAIDGSGFGVIDVLNPQANFPTTMSGQFYGASGASEYFYMANGRQNSTTQFDGFSIFATATVMTGTYAVYGYNK